jgi:hypothetical protein
MNETKLNVVYDNILPKVNVLKKKQVTLDGTLTHLSKERKKLEFPKDNELYNNNCPKDESQTENRWTEKTISQFESNESQKENNNELSVFTQKQEEEQLIAPLSPDEFMWFDYGEIKEKKLSEKEDLLHSFCTLLKMKSPSKDPYLNQISKCIDAQLLIIENKILTETEL